MASEKRMRKISKKNHWGRGKSFLKGGYCKMKRVAIFNSPMRKEIKKIEDWEFEDYKNGATI